MWHEGVRKQPDPGGTSGGCGSFAAPENPRTPPSPSAAPHTSTADILAVVCFHLDLVAAEQTVAGTWTPSLEQGDSWRMGRSRSSGNGVNL